MNLAEHEGLVRRMARYMLGRLGTDPAWDYDDLLQWGRIGLARAADQYDPGRGARFSTFAARLILNEMSDGIWGTDRNQKRAHVRGEAAPVYVRGTDPEWHAAPPCSPEALLDIRRRLARIRDPRDLRVLELLAEGWTYVEVGREIGVSKTRVQILRERALRQARR